MTYSMNALAVIHWLAAQSLTNSHSVPDEVCKPRYLVSVQDELVRGGLIVNEDRMSGSPQFAVLPQALSRIDRLSTQYRRASTYEWILSKVHENPDKGEIGDYFPVDINYSNGPVTKEEYENAVDFLTSKELVKGIETGQGSLVRPELTADGRAALDSGIDPAEWIRNSGSRALQHTHIGDVNSSTFHGSASGPIQVGRENTVNYFGSSADDLQVFRDALEEIREYLNESGLGPEELESSLELLEVAEESVEVGNNSRAKRMLNSFLNGLPTAFASQLAVTVGTAINSLVAGQ